MNKFLKQIYFGKQRSEKVQQQTKSNVENIK